LSISFQQFVQKYVILGSKMQNSYTSACSFSVGVINSCCGMFQANSIADDNINGLSMKDK